MNRVWRVLSTAALASLTALAVSSLFDMETPALEPNQTSLSSLRVAQTVPISSDNVLREINRLRSNPTAYADWLETTRSYYDDTILSWPGQLQIQTREGVYALDEAIAALRQTPPLPPLELSDGLTHAANDHVKDLLEHNRFSLVGSDGSTSENRIERYGFYEGVFRELLNQGLADPVAIVAGLVVNDGNPDRSDRQTLLTEDFRYAGIHCAPMSGLALCATNFAVLYAEAGTVVEDPFGEIVTAGIDPFTQPLTPEILTTLSIDIIAETNLVRSDPVGYAAKLEALRPYYQDRIVKIPGQPAVATEEGVAALDEAIADLKLRTPMPLLENSPGLNRGAADHAQDVGSRGGFSHSGQDGSKPMDRAQRYGLVPPGEQVGENISYGPPTLAEWHVIQLLVDDNVPSRAHREAMLRPRYRLGGAACAPHNTEFRLVCVVLYASDYEE